MEETLKCHEKNHDPDIVFDESAKEVVLDLLGKTVNQDSFIVEKSNPEQKVLTTDGNEILLEDFGGVQKGSEIFIEDNLVSLITLSKKG